jgi:hypothetical protein
MASPHFSGQEMQFGIPSMHLRAYQGQYCAIWYSKVSGMFNLDDDPVNWAESPKTALTL